LRADSCWTGGKSRAWAGRRSHATFACRELRRSDYAGEKAALPHAARILAKECRRPVNIRVNVIAPGVMAAGMAEASIASGKYER